MFFTFFLANALSDTDLYDSSKYETIGKNLRERDKLERGYTSDSELYNSTSTAITSSSNIIKVGSNANSNNDVSNVSPQQRNDWILVC
jgi:hypothetical protein